jgi:hypothetical protein
MPSIGARIRLGSGIASVFLLSGRFGAEAMKAGRGGFESFDVEVSDYGDAEDADDELLGSPRGGRVSEVKHVQRGTIPGNPGFVR